MRKIILAGLVVLALGPLCAHATLIGAAKQITSTNDGLPETVTIDYVFENFGTQILSNISASDDLSAVFGVSGVDWVFTSISSSPALYANPSFNGSTFLELVNQAPGQLLAVGGTAVITVTIELLTNQTAGPVYAYCNQVTVSGVDPSGRSYRDLSTNGNDPDPNGDGNPNESLLSCMPNGETSSVGVPAAVPSPATLALFSVGLFGIAHRRRRR